MPPSSGSLATLSVARASSAMVIPFRFIGVRFNTVAPAWFRKRGDSPSNHPPPCQIPHQRPDPKNPRLALIRVAHAVHEAAELRGRDGDDVAELMREALALGVAILDRRE